MVAKVRCHACNLNALAYSVPQGFNAKEWHILCPKCGAALTELSLFENFEAYLDFSNGNCGDNRVNIIYDFAEYAHLISEGEENNSFLSNEADEYLNDIDENYLNLAGVFDNLDGSRNNYNDNNDEDDSISEDIESIQKEILSKYDGEGSASILLLKEGEQAGVSVRGDLDDAVAMLAIITSTIMRLLDLGFDDSAITNFLNKLCKETMKAYSTTDLDEDN